MFLVEKPRGSFGNFTYLFMSIHMAISGCDYRGEQLRNRSAQGSNFGGKIAEEKVPRKREFGGGFESEKVGKSEKILMA